MNRKLLPWIASVVGSYVGWWIGERWGFAAGAILSLVGLAVGLGRGEPVMRRLVFVAAPLAACSGAGEAKRGIEPSHRGVYLGGSQLNSFMACGDKKMYWVEGKASFGQRARGAHDHPAHL